MKDPRAPHLVYVDESGMDERDNYGYGYAPIGERYYYLKSGRRQGRINMMAGYRGTQLIAPFTIEGACNRRAIAPRVGWVKRTAVKIQPPNSTNSETQHSSHFIYSSRHIGSYTI